MDGQADNVEDDDLQPHNKYLSLVEKRQNVMKQRKIDVVSSKKQKVAEHSYEATNLDSSTPATININLQTEQDDYVEHKDLPAHYKYNYTEDKEKHIHNDVMVDKSKCTNEIKQNKISIRPSATVPASV
ncbi:unnamed protein product [Miscanthus lutarioriparius]|uniref:Uncharacterized protein n=1 Tax=Miscanthus lutarioriparius TaxID=422564 RepID=A0A811MXY8_9POAL|nr:unnamed protein product [Miscanthus lutarioriparius]